MFEHFLMFFVSFYLINSGTFLWVAFFFKMFTLQILLFFSCILLLIHYVDFFSLIQFVLHLNNVNNVVTNSFYSTKIKVYVRHFQCMNFILIENLFVFFKLFPNERSDSNYFLFLVYHSTGKFEAISEN